MSEGKLTRNPQRTARGQFAKAKLAAKAAPAGKARPAPVVSGRHAARHAMRADAKGKFTNRSGG